MVVASTRATTAIDTTSFCRHRFAPYASVFKVSIVVPMREWSSSKFVQACTQQLADELFAQRDSLSCQEIKYCHKLLASIS